LLQFSLFGSFSLQQDGREIRIKSLKLRAILGYVVLSEQLVETRERLVGLLWSESGEAQARAVLRQVIRELREIFADAGRDRLRINAHEIGFERDAVDLDVWAVVRAAEAGQVHPLLLERQHIADDLLAGLEDLDPSFRGWLLARRHLLSDRLLRALEKALDRTDDPNAQAQLAEAILNLDPTHEEACRRLMLASATSGRTAHALRTYKALWDLLDQDFGMEPSKATQDLVADIKLGVYEHGTLTKDDPASPAPPPDGFSEASPSKSLQTPPDPSASASQPQTRLLLSLQAVNTRQVQPDMVHLVVGFRQLLIASLVKFREWHVTDVPFRPPAEAMPPDGDERYEIQIFASQNRQVLQLTLMLKALATGFYVWSDGFELNLATWFDSQHRVIRRVAMALNVHLSAERLRRLSGRPDIKIGVHDRWLRCQTLLRTFDPQHWASLAAQFNEIIEAAPHFVPAYCGLADMHSIEHIAHPGIFRDRSRAGRALELARKAVELDAADIHAHRTLAWAHAMMKQYGQAELHIQVASELNPHDSWTTISAALLLAFCGQYRRATELGQSALDMTLSPSLTHWAYQTDIQFLSGNYEAAVEAADRARDVLWGVAAWRTAALSHLGRAAEAAAEGARFLARIRANWFGSMPATDQAITRWFLHVHPIRRHADWKRLRDGLQAAGLPAGGCEFDNLSTAAPDVSNTH
jgi:DNA-binding SARP family transcriptional activator/tetratricopeptide (TPR) repeat protein